MTIKNCLKTVICVALILSLLLTSFSVVTLDALEHNYKKIVSFGDSISAGMSLDDYNVTINKDAVKELRSLDEILALYPMNVLSSPRGCYPRLLGKAYGGEVYNLSNCGLSSTQLLRYLNNELKLSVDYNQHLNSTTDLVTLNVGLNNLSHDEVTNYMLDNIDQRDRSFLINLYLSIVDPDINTTDAIMNSIIDRAISCVLSNGKKAFLGLKTIQALLALVDSYMPTEFVNNAIKSFQNDFPKIIDKIKQKAPNAKIVAVSFYNPFDGKSDVEYKRSLLNAYDAKLSTLKGSLKIGVKKLITPIVDVFMKLVFGNPLKTYTNNLNSYLKQYVSLNKTKYNLVYADVTKTVSYFDVDSTIDPHPTDKGHIFISQQIIDALEQDKTPISPSDQDQPSLKPSDNKSTDTASVKSKTGKKKKKSKRAKNKQKKNKLTRAKRRIKNKQKKNKLTRAKRHVKNKKKT